MQPTSTDHPLRQDPLNALPDAITVPRRPRPRATTRTPSPPPSRSHSKQEPHPSALLAATSSERREFEAQALSLLHSGNDDPLIAEAAARAEKPPSPPAGKAFATDVNQLFAVIDDHTDTDDVPIEAGIVDRSDVTLYPANVERGAAAGVYIVRSRKNWAFSGNSPGGGSPSAEEYYHVRRSLADFAWLEERLRSRYEGVIVPPLPSMAFAGRLKHGYAYDAERLRGLERFLRRIATHAVLSTVEEVMAFLGATGEESWVTIRREPISHESSITSALFGGAAKDSNALGKIGLWGEKMLWQAGRRVNKSLVWFLERDSQVEGKCTDSAEARLERLQAYVCELGISLAALRQAIERVAANRGREVRGVLAMQQALHKFGEREGGKFGAFMEKVVLEIGTEEEETECESSGSIGALPVERAVNEVFRDYEERARGAQRIMNARKEEQDAYEHALSVYTKLRDRLESRTGSMWETVPNGNTPPKSAEGLEELVNNVGAASARLAEVRRRYQTVALSTTDELRRLRGDMHEDLCRAFQGMAEEFARQHTAHARAWKRLGEILAECRDTSGNKSQG